MGYCYTQQGQLCCDICGEPGARKVPCPFGWCQPIASCPTCRKTHKAAFTKAKHREGGCERRQQEFTAQQDRRAALLASGAAVRCSALDSPPHGVHVLFERSDGTCEGWYMEKETYRVLPLLEAYTPDDYRKHGSLRPAPDHFYGGRTTKEVVLA